ncbi:MAG: hypothetical protein H6852_08360 [Geminicoccaceae bacterium]|jgi:hypothetical protein|nr:hypothetical protein [Geminicoccaceae bacterium]MCB9967633.1 hypothetical protein [Geminicoccaceae bacterium]HRY27380.1 hypothetical protein [Geminicoccaceae bacterium]
MTDRLMALAAFFTLFGFLGILIWNVPHWDLVLVVLITLLLVAWDFIATLGKQQNGG